MALPARTIRGLRLFVGQATGAVTIRNLQVARVQGNAHNTYRRIDLNAGLTTEGLRVDSSSAEALTFETLPAASNPFLQLDLTPLPLLRDTQIAWAQRALIALIAAAVLIWLYGRLQLPASLSRIADGLQGRAATAASAALWFAATFAVYFVYAGRIESFGWNSIEFIIANHLEDFGRYALGANYPAAIWRPVGPTFMVLAINVFARDPLLTYQLLAGLALASLVTSTYLLNRRLFGQLLAHAGAALAFVTPLVSLSLINHAHAISHLGFLLVASPTLLASVVCILSARDGKPIASWLWMASAGWALCYLCRPESMLMAACFFLLVGVMAIRRRQIAPLVLPLAVFIAVFAGFNVWASANAARDDIWSRKMIYLFYASQGWTEVFEPNDRAGTQAADHESAGYARAIQLYGTPAENAESVLHAIARNPKAFAARIGSNLGTMIDLLAKGRALPIVLLLLIVALPFSVWLLPPPFRLVAAFAAVVASTIGIFLIFHIDDRYLTIAVPAALLLGSLSAYGLNRLPMPPRFGRNAFASILLVVALGHRRASFRRAVIRAFSVRGWISPHSDRSARDLAPLFAGCPRQAADRCAARCAAAARAQVQCDFAAVSVFRAHEPLPARAGLDLPARSTVLGTAMSRNARGSARLPAAVKDSTRTRNVLRTAGRQSCRGPLGGACIGQPILRANGGPLGHAAAVSAFAFCGTSRSLASASFTPEPPAS